MFLRRTEMARLYHRLNKKTGVTYVYSIEKSYWGLLKNGKAVIKTFETGLK